MNQSGRSKKGWYRIGGQTNFYKAILEARFAAILELCRTHKQFAEALLGHIVDSWGYEPKTFDFSGDQIKKGLSGKKRGVTVNRPDFGVHSGDKIIWYECKGAMEQRDFVRIRCMKRYFPDEIMYIVVDRIPKGNTRSSRKKLNKLRECESLGYEVIEIRRICNDKIVGPMIAGIIFRGFINEQR